MTLASSVHEIREHCCSSLQAFISKLLVIPSDVMTDAAVGCSCFFFLFVTADLSQFKVKYCMEYI